MTPQERERLEMTLGLDPDLIARYVAGGQMSAPPPRKIETADVQRGNTNSESRDEALKPDGPGVSRPEPVGSQSLPATSVAKRPQSGIRWSLIGAGLALGVLAAMSLWIAL